MKYVGLEQQIAQDYARLYPMEQTALRNQFENNGLSQFGTLASLAGSLMGTYGIASGLGGVANATQQKLLTNGHLTGAANKVIGG